MMTNPTFGWDLLFLLRNCELEEFKLLTRSIRLLKPLPMKNLKIAKLLICNTKYTYLTKLGKKRFHTLDMHLCILHACTMPEVNGKLKHRESITLKLLAKLRSGLTIALGIGRQIKQYEHPHNTIFTETFHIIKVLISSLRVGDLT